MTGSFDKALLPAGLQDLLPPDARHEASAVGRLLSAFRAQGYQQVKPPMLEFEEALLSGPGAALGPQTFRLMDPVSHRMMGLRADMTPQVARIAATRLAQEPRPLRLCYAGQVLQVRGSQLRPERQIGQVGAELIGIDAAAADAEVILLAAAALEAAGVSDVSVDLNLPTLVTALAAAEGFDAALSRDLARALDGKDAAAVKSLAGDKAPRFLALLGAAGPAESSLARLEALDLAENARREIARIAEVVALIRTAAPALQLTLDPAEHRGFEYQTGISFILFARGVRGELGRGGRYRSRRASEKAGEGGGEEGEACTGFTLFTDTLMRAVEPPETEDRLFVPLEVPHESTLELRAAGWITVRGLTPVADPHAEAKRLACSHIFVEGRAVERNG